MNPPQAYMCSPSALVMVRVCMCVCVTYLSRAFISLVHVSKCVHFCYLKIMFATFKKGVSK